MTTTNNYLTVNFNNLKGLPSPVSKYFRYVLRDGRKLIRVVRLEQTGKLKINQKTKNWAFFKASQIILQDPVSFKWDADIKILPFFHIHVCDSFDHGVAEGKVTLLRSIPIAQQKNVPELNSGALYRYLAEAVWHPTSLLPEAGVKWEPLDDNKAIAHLSNFGISISLEFRFNDIGEITGIFTKNRYGRFNNNYIKYPWEGRFNHYREFNGIKIPTKAEVGWHLPEGWWLFWKGQVIKVNFEFECTINA